MRCVGLFRFRLVIVYEEYAPRPCSYRSQMRRLHGGKQSVFEIFDQRDLDDCAHFWRTQLGASLEKYSMVGPLTFCELRRKTGDAESHSVLGSLWA